MSEVALSVTNDKDIVSPLGGYEFLFINVEYFKGGCYEGTVS